MKLNAPSAAKRFTLIELLVVIAIIVCLDRHTERRKLNAKSLPISLFNPLDSP